VTAPSSKSEGFQGLLPGHPIRGPKYFERLIHPAVFKKNPG